MQLDRASIFARRVLMQEVVARRANCILLLPERVYTLPIPLPDRLNRLGI
jgi:hypothetical protein